MSNSLNHFESANLGVIDRVLICWAFLWSFALSILVVGLLIGRSSDDLSDEGAVTLGVAMGGLSAVWSLIGTWIFLIDLSVISFDQRREETTRQRMRPRLLVLGYWLANMVVVSACVFRQTNALAQILLTAATGVLFVVIAFQWTNQRIHRGTKVIKNKRSIRQILGVTTTVAIVIAVLQAADKSLSLSGSLTALVVSSSLLWLIMSVTMLGRWWGISLLTIPAVIVQWTFVFATMDLQSRVTESLIMRFSGTIVGFYFFSLMFLMLMRSSGHRWIRYNPVSTTKT